MLEDALTPAVVTCPRCGQAAPPKSENRAWPFCSARCRLLDLGGWLDESYRVPGDPEPPPDNN